MSWAGYFLPSKLPLPMGALEPQSNKCFLGPTDSTSHTASWLVQTLLRPFTLQQDAPFGPEICPFAYEIWTPSNTQFLGPTQAYNPNGILINSAILQGSQSRQTIATLPVTIGRIYHYHRHYLLVTPGLARSPKIKSLVCGTDCVQARCPCCHQQTVSNHWTENNEPATRWSVDETWQHELSTSTAGFTDARWI